MHTARRAILWLALLIVPHVFMLAWIFHGSDALPRQYFHYFYNFGDEHWPVIWGAPLYLLAIGALMAFAAPREEKPERGIAYMLAVFALIGVAVSPFLFGNGFLISVARLLPGVLMLGAALSVGLRILELPWFAIDASRTATIIERIVLAAALGLGFVALLVFVLGTAGVLTPHVWWPLLVVLLAIGIAPLWRERCRLHDNVRTYSARQHPIAVGAVIICGLFLLAHVALLWSPPLDYDVLEYHLGGPAQHFRAGRIEFLDQNMYANMPANAEMLSLLPMVLLGGRLEGLPGGHLMVFAAWMLTAAGVYALTVRLLRTANPSPYSLPQGEGKQQQLDHVAGIAGAIAALLFLLVPLGSELAADFFVEHLQTLFHIAALICACAFLQERFAGVRAAFGWLVLAGLLCGFGVGVKYPTLLFTIAPIFGFVVIALFLNGGLHEAIRASLSIGGAALVAFSPWMVRNGLASGDVLFPMGKVMGARWSSGGSLPSRIDALEVALRPGRNDPAGWIEAIKSLWPGLGKPSSWLLGMHAGPHLLAWLPASIGALFVFRSRATLLVLFVFLWDLFAWTVLTHRVDRFFFPCLAPLAVLAGLGFAAVWKQLESRKLLAACTAFAVILMGPLNFFVVYTFARPDAIVGIDSAEDAARRQYHLLGNGVSFEAWRAVNSLPPNSRALFIGEAQTFYLTQTPEYSTVFDTPQLEDVLSQAESPEEVASMLLSRGITHVYINAFEWSRLDRTYSLQRKTNGETRSGWERATISPDTRKDLDKLLAERSYEQYAAIWPDGVLPGYLLLTDESYSKLERFIQFYTKPVWSSELLGAPGFEVRQITISMKP